MNCVLDGFPDTLRYAADTCIRTNILHKVLFFSSSRTVRPVRARANLFSTRFRPNHTPACVRIAYLIRPRRPFHETIVVRESFGRHIFASDTIRTSPYHPSRRVFERTGKSYAYYVFMLFCEA